MRNHLHGTKMNDLDLCHGRLMTLTVVKVV